MINFKLGYVIIIAIEQWLAFLTQNLDLSSNPDTPTMLYRSFKPAWIRLLSGGDTRK